MPVVKNINSPLDKNPTNSLDITKQKQKHKTKWNKKPKKWKKKKNPQEKPQKNQAWLKTTAIMFFIFASFNNSSGLHIILPPEYLGYIWLLFINKKRWIHMVIIHQ